MGNPANPKKDALGNVGHWDGLNERWLFKKGDIELAKVQADWVVSGSYWIVIESSSNTDWDVDIDSSRQSSTSSRPLAWRELQTGQAHGIGPWTHSKERDIYRGRIQGDSLQVRNVLAVQFTIRLLNRQSNTGLIGQGSGFRRMEEVLAYHYSPSPRQPIRDRQEGLKEKMMRRGVASVTRSRG
jgi:hypothetical protein